MTRTSKADANLFSISANTYQWYAGTDRVQSVENAPEHPIFAVGSDGRADWDSFLKICDGTKGVNWTGVEVSQGHENAVDFNNRVESCSLDGTFGHLGQAEGDQVFTVKGGCRQIKLSGVIHSKGRVAHVTVGNWSDQCFDVSRDLDFSGLVHVEGRPLTFVLARCRGVKLPPGAKVLRWKSLGLSLYWYLKWLYVKALNLLS